MGGGRGGAEPLLVQALRFADREQFDYEYAFMLPHKTALCAQLQELNAPVHLVRAGSQGELLTAPWRLSQLVRERQVDLIHAHLPVAGMVARFGGVLAGAPVVYTEHNLNERYKMPTRWGNRLTWPLNDACIAVSESVAESIGSNMPRWPRVPVLTIPNGVDVDQFSVLPSRDEARQQLGISPDAKVIITVAVFRTQKRLDLWLQTARRIRQSLAESEFLVVGDGPLWAKVHGWRESLDLQREVRLVGQQIDVKPFLAAADLFLSTSDFEGLPLAVIEAMAAGIPVVATRAGGMPSLVGAGDEAAGRLADKGDVRGCAEQAVALLSDRNVLAATGRAAQARAREHFSVRRMVGDYEGLYREILSHRAARER
jgi:glycosyltransferase involved in cell wall biosynthesis